MICFSGKVSNAGRVYALLTPAVDGEHAGFVEFGYLPKLAESMLLAKGWCRPGSERLAYGYKELTADEVHAACEALLDPHIDPWGYRLVSAETQIARTFAYLADLDDVFSYYTGPEADKAQALAEKAPVPGENGSLSYPVLDDPMELRICEAVANIRERSEIHLMLKELTRIREMQEELTPDVVRAIQKQIDESDVLE